MRLYPKRLRSIEDLEREKFLLLRESRQLDKEDFLSVDSILGRKKSKGDGKDSAGGSLLDLIPLSNPVVGQVVKMASRVFLKKVNAPKPAKDGNPEGKGRKRNLVKSVAIEFVGGYLKWKAIELSVRGIKYIIRARKKPTQTPPPGY